VHARSNAHVNISHNQVAKILRSSLWRTIIILSPVWLNRLTDFLFKLCFFFASCAKCFPNVECGCCYHMWCSLNSCANNCKLFNSFTVCSFPRNLSLKRVTWEVMLDSLLSSSNLKKPSKTILGLFWNVSNCFNGVEMWLKNPQGNVRLPIMSKTLKTKDSPVCKKNTAYKTKIARKARSSCWCICTPSEEFC